MKPILYESRETDFNHNGLGKMNETLSAIVTEVANGEFELEVVYPIGGRLYKHIQDHMLIKAKPNSVDDPHVFRIYEHTIDTVGQTVTIYAHTKSNDLGQNLVKDVVISSLTPQEAMNSMKMNLVEPTDYSFVSDITTRSSTEWKNRNPLNCIAGEEGSLIHYWGGEIKRDNRTVYLYRRRGRDNVAIIRDGKNIDGLSLEYSTKGMVTKIIPYRTYTPEDSDDEVVEYGTPVESQYIGNYPLVYVRAIDYSNDDDVTSLQTMNAKANRYFTENNGVDKPSVNVNMSLVELSDSSEYEKFKDFENVELFDTVTVYSKQYDIHIEAKITTLVYDSLAGKNISLEMGSYRTGLIESTERTYMGLIGEKEAKLIQTIQVAANGKNRIFRGVDEPTTGMVKNDLWYKPVGDGETEMYQFDGAYWQIILNTKDINANKELVDDAVAKAEEAKQVAEQAYSDSVAEAERLVGEQTVAFDAEMDIRKGEILEAKEQADLAVSTANSNAEAIFGKLDVATYEANKTAVETELGKKLATATYNAQKQTQDALIAGKVAIDTYNTKVSELNSLITEAQTTADTAAADLLDKADTATVNAELAKKLATSTYNTKMASLDTAISGHDTRIEATEDGLALTATKVEVDAVRTRMSEAETEISQNSDAIALKASQSSLDTTNGKLATAEATLLVQAGQIASKVSQTDFDTLNGRVGTAETSIKANTTAINLRATKTDLDATKGRLTTAEGTITAQAGQIALKANTTTVNALTSRVNAAEASLSVQSGKIDLAATKSELTSAIDGIEIGGRNQAEFRKWETWAGDVEIVDNKTFRLSNPANSVALGINQTGADLKLEPNSNYVFSFLIRKISGTLVSIGGHIAPNFSSAAPTYIDGDFISSSFTTSGNTHPDLGDGNWHKVVTYLKSVNTIFDAGLFYIQPNRSSYEQVVVEIKEIQFEKGNKATDWTPAPEDVDDAISTVQANLTVEAGKIASKVSQTDFNALSGRVGTAESSITQQAGQIALKASQTSVDTLAGRVGTAETNISANTTAINLRATKSSVDTLTGRVTTAEGNITTQAGQIALRATTATVNALTGRVSTAESTISANTTAINLRATKTELTTAIDGIEIGGRNLFTNSNFYTGDTSTWFVNGTTSVVTIDGFNAIKLTGSERGFYNYPVGREGGVYTVSFKAKPVGTTSSLMVGFLNVGTQKIISVTGNWTRYYFTTVYVAANQIFHFYANANTGSGLYITDIKLEKGNKATDWTPAPEDVDASIATVQANLTVEAGKITSLTTRVGTAESNITSVTQTVNGINTTISTLRTDVNGKATIVALNQVKSTADGNKTTISNHAGRLTTVESNVSGLQTTVASKADKSQITQLSDAIVLKADKTALSNKKDEYTTTITINGNGNTYYPLYFIKGNQSIPRVIRITRHYNALAPGDIWNPSQPTHPGGLNLEWVGNFGGWGGAQYEEALTSFGEVYTTMLADLGRDHSSQSYVFYLRGGGANYTVSSDQPLDLKVGYSINDTIFGTWKSSAPRTSVNRSRIDGLVMAQNSQISVLSDAINLRVTKGELMSEINVQAGRTIISTGKLYLDTGSTIMTTAYVNDLKAKSLEAVTANITSIRSQVLVTDSVTSTHIKAENALIDTIFGTTALITRLTSKTAFINNIKAIDISADRITTGTLNASNVSIINLNASNIKSGTLSAIKVTNTFNRGSGVTGTITIDSDINMQATDGSRFLLSEKRISFSDGDYETVLRNDGIDFYRGGVKHMGQRFFTFEDGTSGIRFESRHVGERALSIRGNQLLAHDGAGGRTGEHHLYLSPGGTGYVVAGDATGARAVMRARTFELNRGVGLTTYDTGDAKMRLYSQGFIWHWGTSADTTNQMLRMDSDAFRMYKKLDMTGQQVVNTSDRRIKTGISPTLIKGRETIRKYNFVDYYYTREGYPKDRQFGLIAQDAPIIGSMGEDGYWTISTTKQTMLNSLAIKEIDDNVVRNSTYITQHDLEIDILKTKIQELENTITLLEEKM